MATILDVAKRANVSKTLVSRVLNDQKGVSPETRDRILQAMKALNYRSSKLARSLAVQKTDTLGVILDTLCTKYFFDLISSLEDSAEAAGYNIIFCSAKGSPKIKYRYVDFFTRGQVDGIIIYGSFHTDESLIRDLASAKFPFVLIENEIPDLDVNNVLVDNVGGSYKATEHLIKRGYKDIMHFTGDMNYKKVTMDRLNGYVKAMQDNAILLRKDSVVYSEFSEKSGYDSMKQIFAAGRRPEAISFAADMTAFGAIRAIYEAGLKVPEDIAIVGFDDDIPDSRDMVFPGLTTVRQPLRALGSASVELLIKNINDPERLKEKSVLGTELIIRESSGA